MRDCARRRMQAQGTEGGSAREGGRERETARAGKCKRKGWCALAMALREGGREGARGTEGGRRRAKCAGDDARRRIQVQEMVPDSVTVM